MVRKIWVYLVTNYIPATLITNNVISRINKVVPTCLIGLYLIIAVGKLTMNQPFIEMTQIKIRIFVTNHDQ